MTIRFSTWVDSLVPTTSSLSATDKLAVVTNAPDTRAITRDDLARSVYATVMTTDGDLITRTGGSPTRITRSGLANDSAFTDKYVQVTTLTTDGDLYTRASGAITRITRSSLADDAAFTNKYAQLSTLTTDGDLYTRSGGSLARITRATLASDSAFTDKYAQLSTIDAKGDLLVGTADNTIGVLTVGTDGYFLAADSNETEGIKWVEPPAGKIVNYAYSSSTTQTVGTSPFTAVSLSYTPQSASNLLIIEATGAAYVDTDTITPSALRRVEFTIRNNTASTDLATAIMSFGFPTANNTSATLLTTAPLVRLVVAAGSTTARTYQFNVGSVANLQFGVLGDPPSILSVTEVEA